MGPEIPPVVMNLTVEYDLPARKPYHGGYRHKVTGIVYHHAGTNTEAPPKPKRVVEDMVAPKFHRETQTKVVREQAVQGVREFGTQMGREDLRVEARTDYVIVAREYKDSALWDRVRLRATIVIQCYARGMFSRSLARKCRYELAYNRSYYLEQQRSEAKEAEERRNREVERRMKPRSRADFELLYNELEAWRVAETRKIEVSEMSAEEKQQARYQLLLKEIKLVQTVDKLKAQAKKSNSAIAISNQLSTMSKPKVWEMSDGTTKEVLTPYTSRAKELGDLYQGLTLPNLRVDERLDVLLHVKWTVKEFDTKLTKEMIELIDREADLLNRGRPDKSLEGLRKRIVRAFLQFIKDPQYNPEARTLMTEKFGTMTQTVGSTA